MARFARFLFAAMVGLFILAGQGHAATPIGTVVAVTGSPTGSGRPLGAGSPVYENDRLQTGRGNVQIIFVDSTKLVVGPNSTLVIDRFLMRGGNSARKFSVDALRGTFRFISGTSAKSAYDIRTANATIGIRGTAFDFSSGRETLLAVFEGGVRLCTGGRCETIPEGCGVGRARSNDVDQLGGRAKGQALRSLPYIVNQGTLARQFRVNTRSCRSSLSPLQTAPGNNRGDRGGPSGGETPGGPSGGGTPGGGPGGNAPGGGAPGGGTPGGGGGGSGGGPGGVGQ
ncbi:MAG: FecR domain-containing protein [Parvibaculaceae bacterium]